MVAKFYGIKFSPFVRLIHLRKMQWKKKKGLRCCAEWMVYLACPRSGEVSPTRREIIR